MTSAVTNLMALEVRLRRDAEQIAAMLAAPSGQGGDIAPVWAGIESAATEYAKALPLIHPKNRQPDDPPDDEATLQARLDLMRNGGARQRLWPKIGELLARAGAGSDPRPLMVERQRYSPDRTGDLPSYMMTLLHHLANQSAFDRDEQNAGQHLDVGLSGAYFINLMQAAYRLAMAQRREGPLRFLDVGCGGGSKVLIASSFFDTAEGLEYNDTFAANGQRTLTACRAKGCKIIHGDALTFDDYGGYDVIYFYRPISDKDDLARMEARMLAQARPGTILIAPFQFTLKTTLADQVYHVVDDIFVAHMTGADGDALVQLAEAVGPDHTLIGEDEAAIAGFFAPIIAAARLRGFAIPK